MFSNRIPEPINISSDSVTIDSPEKTNICASKEKDLQMSESYDKKCIIISDTELEEGEIDEEENEDEVQESSDEGNEVHESNLSSKRKLVEDSGEEPKKIPKLMNTVVDEDYNPIAVPDTRQEFSWSDLKVLMVGDERVLFCNWEEWEAFPQQELSHLPKCNMDSLCSLIEKHLYKEFDVVLILAFHYDFVLSGDGSNSDTNHDKRLRLNSDIDMRKILKTVQKYHQKWLKQYPDTHIIWTIPSPPNFLRYNSIRLAENGLSGKKLNRKEQNDMSKDYFNLCTKFAKEWKEHNNNIPMFSLSKVLFLKKPKYKRSFTESGSPRFPSGYLTEGFYPSKIMTMYCAYFLVEFLIQQGFYTENPVGLDLFDAEERLVEIAPETKNYIQSSNNHRRHSKHNRHKHKHNGSISRSGSPAKASHLKRHHHRASSRSKRSNTTRSNSKESRKKDSSCSETSSIDRRKSRSHSGSRDRSHDLKGMDRLNPDNTRSVQTKEESAFWKTVQNLRDLHQFQCAVYRRKPHMHPQYQKEKEKYFKNLRHRKPNVRDLSRWDERWKIKMEDIFLDTWAKKEYQLTKDLSKKGSFTSFNIASSQSNNVSDNPKYTANTITSFLGISTSKSEPTEPVNKNNVSITSFLNQLNTHLKAQAAKNQTALDSTEINKPEFNLDDIFPLLSSEKKNCELSDGAKKSSVKQASPENKPKSPNELDKMSSSLQKPSVSGGTLDNKPKSPNLVKVPEMSSLSSPKRSDRVDSPDKNPQSPNPVNVLAETSQTKETSPLRSAESEDESINSGDSDFDLDGLMENTDFLKGLDEIDKELQNAIPKSDCILLEEDMEISQDSDKSDTQTVVPENQDKVTTVGEEHVPVQSKSDPTSEDVESTIEEDEVKTEFVNVLKMLFRVSKRLGPLGVSISALYQRASEDLQNKSENFPSISPDSKTLLILVNKKISFLLTEDLPQVQKAIFGEISMRLQALLQNINVEYSKFPKVNIQSIACATVDKRISEIIAFVKNTLLYHGYTQFTTEDIMEIYTSVTAAHKEMAKT